MPVMPFPDRAFAFAVEAHRGQRRKYVDQPYIVHPMAVAKHLMINMETDEDTLDKVMAVALLHDTMEDTRTTYERLEESFGQEVAWAVYQLTDTPPSKGNRAIRKMMDGQRLAGAGWLVQTVKYADLFHNLGSIINFDPRFARVFVREARDLLSVLYQGDGLMRAITLSALDQGIKSMKSLYGVTI